MSDLLIVIVNYKTPGLTIDCLRSLEPELAAVPSTRVVVTDNLSGGDSVQQIGAAIAANNWGSWATLMPLPRNGGFAYGNNEGIRPALESSDPPRYVWLLNPDTLVKPGAVRAMIDFLAERMPQLIEESRLHCRNCPPEEQKALSAAARANARSTERRTAPQ